MLFRSSFRNCTLTLLFASVAALSFAAAHRAEAQSANTLVSLAGRWVGEGRLGIKDNPPESVKCRATYIAGANADQLKQTIRCATAGGAIEVISDVTNTAGVLKGTWKETMHNMGGDLEGQITSSGFRIVVKGAELAANMEIIAKNEQQIVEIQFYNSPMIGLTLVLKKG